MLACEWTGDCPVDGCANKCQLFPLSVGGLTLALEDRAYDLDWWQMCPGLALQLGLLRDTAAPSPISSDIATAFTALVRHRIPLTCAAISPQFSMTV